VNSAQKTVLKNMWLKIFYEKTAEQAAKCIVFSDFFSSVGMQVARLTQQPFAL
jgi:hypothetical protein